jgi:hypothetical protein
VNERNNENVFIRHFVDEAIGLHEQLSNGIVTELRHDLATSARSPSDAAASWASWTKGGSVEFRVSCDVLGRTFKIVPSRTGPDYLSSHRAIRFSISSCGMTLPF